jgi:hypothetical protein
VLHDPDYRIARHYGIRGVPSSFILDAGGNIRFVDTGLMPESVSVFTLWSRTSDMQYVHY